MNVERITGREIAVCVCERERERERETDVKLFGRLVP